MPTPLHQLGENAVLQRLLQRLTTQAPMLTGPGDDCAVVPRDSEWDTLLKTDVVVEAVHFTRDTPPERVGYKALARAVSDIAAMGGIPEYALITLLMHPQRTVETAEGIYTGLNTCAALYGISVAGGETSSLPYDGIVINVALTGRVEHGRAFLRSGGKPGDIICVSGPLGGSFPSGRHLDFKPRLNLARHFMKHGPRPTAMMDLSDGLGADLPRLAAASGCSYQLCPEQIPCHAGCSIQQAISDGEDYELLFTLTPQDFNSLNLHNLPQPVFPIGELSTAPATPLSQGWQHFRA
ncbi:MAG: thiamine-monophosphate kinase [Akkermansia sp.]|nr:thiamine-monophosphate kinase [Akkermansia sp.]MBQ7024253.1 thiamine-monophosphate kinase [Akkermansia sp.]